MIIAQISDSHLTSAVPERGASLAACVRHITALPAAPDVVVHTGDVVHDGTAEQYAVAAEILGKLDAPLYVIPGNKDVRETMRAGLAPVADLGPGQRKDFVHYAVDDFPLRLVMLDSLSYESNKGRLCQHRLAFVDEILAIEPQRPTVLFVHHTPFEVPIAKDPFQFESRDDVASFARILEKAGNVTSIICGHIHREVSGLVGGVPATAMASLAVDLRFGEFAEAERGLPIYHLHNFSSDGALTTARMAVPL